MADPASGSFGEYRMAKQATFTAVSVAQPIILNMVSETIKPSIATTESAIIRKDRAPAGTLQTGRGIEGALNTELKFDGVDHPTATATGNGPWSLYEGVLMSDSYWSTNGDDTTDAGGDIVRTANAAAVSCSGAFTNILPGDFCRITSASNAGGYICKMASKASDDDATFNGCNDIADTSGASVQVERLEYMGVGTTKHYWSGVKALTDLGQYETSVGISINGMTLQTTVNSILTQSFTVLGEQVAQIDGTPVMDTGLAAATSNISMTALTNVKVQLGGIRLDVLQNIGLNTTNNQEGRSGIGKFGTQSIKSGNHVVSGTIEALLDDVTINEYKKITNLSGSNIGIICSDSNGVLVFDVPMFKYTDAQIPIQGTNTDIILRLDYSSEYDPTTTRGMRIWRI